MILGYQARKESKSTEIADINETESIMSHALENEYM